MPGDNTLLCYDSDIILHYGNSVWIGTDKTQYFDEITRSKSKYAAIPFFLTIILHDHIKYGCLTS